MALTLLFKTKRTRIDTLELDAAISEAHSGTNEVTDHPVEDGADITDHVRVKPDTVTIEGIISNTPVIAGNARFEGGLETSEQNGVLVVSGVGADSLDDARAESAYQQLLKIKEDRLPVVIVTSLRQYERMILERLNVPRDARIGSALRFSATFREVRTVASQRVSVTLPKARDKVRGGKKTGTQAPPAVENRVSFLKQGLTGIKKWFAKP